MAAIFKQPFDKVIKVFGTLTLGLLIITGCQNSKNKPTENKVEADFLAARQSDTLLIADMEKISDPFSFGEKPLTYIQNMITLSPTFREIEDYSDSTLDETGNHVKQKFGTIYRLKYGDDYFQFYKRADSVEMFLTSELLTNQFPNKWDIKIGMTKQEVKGRLTEFKINNIPTTLIIGDLEYTFIQFDFDNGRLIKISYVFYVD